MKSYDNLKSELHRLLVSGHNYGFIEFVEKAYQIIYVDSCRCSSEQIQSLRKIYKDYLRNKMFTEDVIPVKLTYDYKVVDPHKKLLKGTKYRIVLAWKYNKKLLTDFDDYECWITER